MKKVFRTVISVTLCLALLVCTATIGITVSADDENVPIIFIHGQGSTLGIYNEDGSFSKVYPVGGGSKSVADTLLGMLSENSSEYLEILKNAFLSQDWTDFCNLLYDSFTDLYKDCKLDENGEAPNGSTTEFARFDDDIRWRYQSGYDGLEGLYFEYDWRMDPYESADSLYDYIKQVQRVTGSQKYALVSRCEGSCVALAFYDRYQNDPIIDDMTDFVFYSSAAKGASPIGEIFAGEICVDADGLERLLYYYDLNLNLQITDSFTLTDESLRKIVTALNNVYVLDIATFAIQNVYDQINESFLPALLLNSYASWPGYWAMVSDEYYLAAKEYLFADKQDTYANFIEKIDNYHYNVMNKAEELIADAQSRGIQVSNVVKYGLQTIPCIENSDVQSDSVVNVYKAGFGVNSAPMGEKFDDDYLLEAYDKGTAKYISPDKEIDASTSMLKDTTWFVKNLNHMDFVSPVNEMIVAIIRQKNSNVFNLEGYSQYMCYEAHYTTNEETGEKTKTSEEIYPLTATSYSLFDEYYAATDTTARKMRFIWKPQMKAICLAIKVLTPKATY